MGDKLKIKLSVANRIYPLTIDPSQESDVFFAISEPDRENVVLKTEVPIKKLNKPLEQFTIEFSKDSTFVNMSLMWDRTSVSIPLE